MKKIFTTLLFALIATGICFAQKQASIWYFGANVGLDFTSGTATIISKPFTGQDQGDTEEGHATISDENGNFLFYTNGVTVWDKNAAVMNNGSGLNGAFSSTQCASIFPLGTGSTKYVVLTTPLTSNYTNGVRYNVVDLNSTTNGGFATGSVVTKNQLMPNVTPSSDNVNMCEALISCPTSTGGSPRWVVTHSKAESGTNGIFYAWKVSANSSGNIIVSSPVQSTIGDKAGPSSAGAAGIAVMKFNNCFNKIALTSYDNKFVQVFSFDNSTGVVSNYDATIGVLKLDVSVTSGGSTGSINHNYGVEFSPNGRYLFVTQSGEDPTGIVGDGDTRRQRLYRYDLQAGSTAALIQASRLSLFEQDMTDIAANNLRRLGHLQLGPDKKIYMTHMNDGIKLSVIGTPDAAAPGFSAGSITWPSTIAPYTETNRTTMGLPSFDKGLLAASVSVVGSDSTGTSITNLGEICSGINTKFTPTYTGNASTYSWDMNVPNGTSPNGGTTAAGVATHKYTAGDYKIVLTVVDALCAYTVRDTSTIKVSQITKATGYSDCVSPNINLIVSNAVSGNKYVWYTDAAGKKPYATGTPVVIAQPGATGSTYTGNYYVKQVDNFTVGTYVVTPAVADIPATTTDMSSIAINTTGTPHTATVSPGTSTATSSGAPAINTIVVSNPITLNSFKFAITGNFSSTAVSYTVTIKNSSSTAIYGPVVVSGDSWRDGGALTIGASTRLRLNGNDRRYFNVSPALSLPVGTYTIEVYQGSAGGNANLDKFSTTLTNPTITGSVTNNGSGSGTSFLFNINVTTALIPGTPAVTKDTITSTSTACAQISAVVPVSCVLPIEFVNFDANKIANGALLNWVTASETNNDHFDIERSVDGINFTVIATTKGAGTKKTLSYYLYTDNNKTNGIVFYRIKQVDTDGNYTYTDQRSVNYGIDEAFSFTVSPNPSNGDFTVKINDPLNEEINVVLMDLVGNTVWSQTFTTESNFQQEINLAGTLSRGVYLLKSGHITHKIIIQ